MKKKFLIGASILSVLAAVPAFAQTDASVNATAETSAGAKIEKTLAETGDAIENAADKAGKKTKAAYQDMKAYFTDENDIKSVTSVNAEGALTSQNLIGLDVMAADGAKKGQIKDIIVNSDGDVEHVIISRNGETVAVDESVMNAAAATGKSVTIDAAALEKAQIFDEKAVSAGLFSVKKLQGAKITDANGKAVANVESIVFEEDDADYIVAAFNQILGLGGDRVALDFDALELIDANGKYSFKMNTEQSAQFKAGKDNVAR